MYGFIGAMEIETDGLIALMSKVKRKKIGAYEFVEGKIGGKKAVVCCCGVGKVFSSTAAALMIAEYKPEGIVSIGVAGGAKPLRQCDIVIAEKTVQHDYDASADGLERGRVHSFDSPYFKCDDGLVKSFDEVLTKLGYEHKIGITATGDCFVGDNKKAADIVETFGACAFDMESAAINQVCVYQGVKFSSLRAISDNGDDEAVNSFYEFVNEAAARSIATIKEFIVRFG